MRRSGCRACLNNGFDNQGGAVGASALTIRAVTLKGFTMTGVRKSSSNFERFAYYLVIDDDFTKVQSFPSLASALVFMSESPTMGVPFIHENIHELLDNEIVEFLDLNGEKSNVQMYDYKSYMLEINDDMDEEDLEDVEDEDELIAANAGSSE